MGKDLIVTVLVLNKLSDSSLTRLPQWGPAVRSARVPAEKPAISVVIPAYNEERFVARTLQSVLDAKSRYKGPIEIIVVDNNSTDATGEIARSLGATVVFEPKNQIARARNAGAKAASGDYLVFLDADTTLEGDILDQVETNLSSGGVIGGGAWVEPDSGWFGRLLFKYVINYALALKNVTVGPFLFCDRKAFLEVGGFDEELYAAEEFSLAKRLKAEGEKQNKAWTIIKYDKQHRVITSNRKFEKFGGLEMAVQNAHLIWKPHQKLREKDHCRFWYGPR
jgi:glycosyltransferase involved in cell wall biosynthesis